jgi:hypothetical protein
MTYIIVDTANTFFRARHVIKGDADIKLGMAFHITLNSIKKAWQDFGGSHVVFCLEGRSWRKDYYEPYKRNRSDARAALTVKEQKTNCTVLQHKELEADDLIAGWIQSHPSDKHVIISTDSDFYQLISPNVSQYNGVQEHHITYEGVFDKKGKMVIDNKTKEPKAIPDPKWLLFEKCIRGDSSDNVFSAYPKVRKNKLEDAFKDKDNRGFAWNNLMLQRWVDHNGDEHRVLEDYERNRRLIDLSEQPADIKEKIFATIKDNIEKEKNVSQVGIRLLKFCQLYDLKKISDQAQQYAEPLNARYHQ